MKRAKAKIDFTRCLTSMLALLFLSTVFYGQTATEKFNTANEAYEKNRFKLAIDTYEEIHKAGDKSEDLYLNLGNAYFETENYAKAILSYERGLRLSPNDESILANLEITRDQLASEIIEVPDFILLRWWRSFCLLFNSTIWSIIQFICLFTAAFLLWRLYKDQLNLSRPKMIAVFTSLLFGFLLFFFAANTNDQLANAQFAILIEKSSLYSGPDDRSDMVEELFPGNKIRIIDQIDDWYKVRLANQSIGWVSKAMAEKI